MVKISLKWNKEKLPEIELDENETLADLQTKIYTLTNVIAEKQKLIFKGSMVKQQSDIDKL